MYRPLIQKDQGDSVVKGIPKFKDYCVATSTRFEWIVAAYKVASDSAMEEQG